MSRGYANAEADEERPGLIPATGLREVRMGDVAVNSLEMG
jgi:hypothetical protein